MKNLSNLQKTFNIILIFILIYCIINISLPLKSLAISTDYEETEIQEIVKVSDALYDADALNTLKGDIDQYQVGGESNENVQNLINKILGIIIAIGIIISVLVIAIIGFNYVLGSAQEKAANQEQLVTVAVGAVVLTAGVTIVKMIYSFVINW